MQLTARLPTRRLARSRQDPGPQPAAPEPSALPRDRAPELSVTQRAARRGGGPEDRALYSCACGYVFTAPVTTSVDCPHCGTEQAW